MGHGGINVTKTASVKTFHLYTVLLLAAGLLSLTPNDAFHIKEQLQLQPKIMLGLFHHAAVMMKGVYTHHDISVACSYLL